MNTRGKYHINPATGEVGKCKALFNCPFGDGNHYDTAQDARVAYELEMNPRAFEPAPHARLRLKEIQARSNAASPLHERIEAKDLASSREPIGPQESQLDLLIKMSEGNPGAIRVLADLVQVDPTSHKNIVYLDDMNIRGQQIWVAYKEYCREDLDVFRLAIDERDQAMVDKVNELCGGPEFAVSFGASLRRFGPKES